MIALPAVGQVHLQRLPYHLACCMIDAYVVLRAPQLPSRIDVRRDGQRRFASWSQTGAAAGTGFAAALGARRGRSTRRRVARLALRPTDDRRVRRRDLSLLSGLLPLALPLEPTAAAGANYEVELSIPQSRLVARLQEAAPRTIVITGANSGVGLAGSKLLSASGHRVICACRTEAKAQKAVEACKAGIQASARPGSAVGYVCDLADLSSVRAFVEKLKQAKEPVDTLVLNAGLSLNATEKGSKYVQRTADGFERTVGTNHFGHFLLANLATPILSSASKPRVVVTASPVHDPLSGGGDVGPPASLGDFKGLMSASFEMVDGGEFDPDKAYKDSKLCNMLFLAEASRRFAGAGITVNAFSPGLIADPEGFFRYQNSTFASIFNQVSRFAGVAETNEFGGSALAFMAVDPDLNGRSGGWYDSYPPGAHQLAKHAASAEARDEAKQKRLWELSAKLTKLV